MSENFHVEILPCRGEATVSRELLLKDFCLKTSVREPSVGLIKNFKSKVPAYPTGCRCNSVFLLLTSESVLD